MHPLDRLVAALYDPVLRGAERAGLGERRRGLLGDLEGHVLEIGAGTGANLPHLGPGVERLTLIEPSPPMLRRLRRRVAADPPSAQVTVVRAPAEALPIADASVDVVVSTLVLCSVGDLTLALAEARRVLRDGGALVVIEHVAAEGSGARAQRLLEPAWKVAARGCHLTRDTSAALVEAGFDLGGVTPWRLPGGGPAAPAISGVARLR
jgi:SAM-dependent methyltransferase